MSSLLAIHLRVNVTARKIQDASGRVWSATDLPTYRAESIIHRLTCVYTDPDDGLEKPFPFTLTQTFKFGVKDPSALSGTTFLCFADNDSFNLPSDWSGINLSQGKICYRFSSNTAAMETFLTSASTSGVEGRAEVEVKDAGEEPFALFQNPCQCYPDVIRGTEGSPVPGAPSYPTSEELSAVLGPGISWKRIGDRAVLMIDGVETASFDKPS